HGVFSDCDAASRRLHAVLDFVSNVQGASMRQIGAKR
ncbi:MAG: hypothetical protein ACJAXU_000256, partial [Paracoccaceae bacterium]